MRFNLYHRFVETLSKEIENFRNKKYLLAVSGGMDSMVMWDLFTRAGLNVVVAHVNFKLRGDESDLDEELIRKTAQERNHPFFVRRVDTLSYARDKRLSIQMAAREIRYRFFQEILQQENADLICTAHHLDDLVETFFIALNQKANFFKLVGIERKSYNLYRPLLHFTKKDLEIYAHQHHITFRIDSSNQKNIYERNQWRNNIIPTIELHFPQFKQHLYQTLIYLQETRDFLRFSLQTQLKPFLIDPQTIDLNKLQTHPFATWILKHYLLANDGDPAWAKDIITPSPRPRTFHGKNHTFYVHHHLLHIEEKKSDEKAIYYIDKDLDTSHLPIPLSASYQLIRHFDDIPRSPNIACMDASKLQFPLILRTWKPGDYFQPFGMLGQKKVSDFLTDLKIPIWKRKKIYVMMSGERIIWLIGLRISQHVAISNTPAKAILWNSKNV